MVMRWKRMREGGPGAPAADGGQRWVRPAGLRGGPGDPAAWGQLPFPTGIACEIPRGCVGLIFTRSGLGFKKGVAVRNGVGVIDSDYRGELHVGLANFSSQAYTVSPGERVAQLVIVPICLPQLEEAEELSATARGEGAALAARGSEFLKKGGAWGLPFFCLACPSWRRRRNFPPPPGGEGGFGSTGR